MAWPRIFIYGCDYIIKTNVVKSARNKKYCANETYDALVLELPVMNSLSVTEQFTIYIDKKNDLHHMFLSWDKTLVAVPIKTVD